jgi:hypothetical protein
MILKLEIKGMRIINDSTALTNIYICLNVTYPLISPLPTNECREVTRTRLDNSLFLLEIMATLPVPEPHASIVPCNSEKSRHIPL